MKFKKLTKEQLIISFDRLTRFKNTKEKYLRVFSDILVSNLIEPKFKKSDIENLDYALISEYVSIIINESLGCNTGDLSINNILKVYENSIFNNDIDTQSLLDNKINYNKLLYLLDKEIPLNLKWLKEVIEIFNKGQFVDLKVFKEHRNKKLLKYPIEKVLLVEGITEEILLPIFSKFLGCDFDSNGVQIIAAGGKNQVVKMYYKLSKELYIPIFILLDKDAEENINQIIPRLRRQDKIHLVSCGEFEDLMPKSLIVKTVNSHFKNFLSITESDLDLECSTVKILEELFKTKGLHEFKKAEFANLVKNNINSEEDISSEIRTIIREIYFINKKLDSKICS